MPTPQKSTVRADIQGLRALAIGLVVLYHLWPNRLTGGFVGVDVFFVISGFLITGHLVKAIAERPHPRMLLGFYARRIRRLAPAAVLVLSFVLVVSLVVLPATSWAPTAWSVLASTFFVENWHLAAQSVSYLETASQPSALQHFWSLSVEEQFYIFWPILLLSVALVARQRAARLLPLVILVVGVLSLAWGVLHTRIDPDVAFFDTSARAWQFAVGGLVAFMPKPAGLLRLPLPWIGIALIAVASLTFSDSTPFPGYAALVPTVGAALVIAGRSEERSTWSWGFVSRFGPIRWLGDVSYSAYLWHWPLIVLTPQVLGRDLDLRSKLAILVATLVLAALSYRFVESPVRRSRKLSAQGWRSFAAGATAAAVLAAGAFGSVGVASAATAAENAAIIAEVSNGESCYAASALDNTKCGDPFGVIDKDKLPASLADKPIAWQDNCIDDVTENTNKLCELGDPQGAETVLLWGDSHAGAWSSAFDIAGKINHWRVIVAARNKCPSSLVAPNATAFGDRLPADQQAWCSARNKWVLSDVAPRADKVVLANLWANYVFPNGSKSQSIGYERVAQGVAALGRTVTVMQHVPLTGPTLEKKVWGPDCLAENAAKDCSNPVAQAYPASTSAVFSRLVRDGYGQQIRYVPVFDRFCDDARCYSAVGGVSVYFDGSHLSHAYSSSLGPWLAKQLGSAKKLAVADFRSPGA
ncbi:acyltransferase family protein [Curtobacterium sp. MCBA15_008]|uniref:acyltransferase family protein n=1 Tax=Curtobacterium sp. MCBA15_008 TaxID=1898736 RepID=UPI001587D386|nr:acyltransferase family protein [Curtobacterium sp. MCBA15_008]